MKVVHGDAVAAEPAVRHRGGNLRARILLEGTPGTPGNFQLSLGETGEDFVSPRHRHNFEQYRAVLEGRYDFGRDGCMTAGMVGYFPAGVHYGPQSSASATVAAVLQFGGTSGGGYLSGPEVEAGMEALKRVGEFRDGIFRRREGVPGRRNQDAFEAIWELVNERRLVYPESSYASPILVHPDNVAATAIDERSGAAEKNLGDFPSHRTSMRMLELPEGASLVLRGRAVFLALSGAGAVDANPYRAQTAFYLEGGETASIEAGAPSRLLRFELPAFVERG
ncbi:MAG TPA: hypothetical protein VFV10_10805 [Gammaproteobacteria bacterium]|nr:hypothetical protein [Gammaproteobacteria bacterium]